MHNRAFVFELLLLMVLCGTACPDEGGAYVVLTNVERDAPYFRAVEALTELRRPAQVVTFEGQALASVRSQLQTIQPRYVAIVATPQTIDANLVLQAFHLSTALDDDPLADFAYGFVTGASAEDAVNLVENTSRAETQAGELPPKFSAVAQTGRAIGLPGRGEERTLMEAMSAYAECFREDGWSTHVAEWGGEDDETWSRRKPEELHQWNGSRLVFIAGHGGPDWAAGVQATDLADADLWPSVVLCGGCETGVVSRWLHRDRDGTVRETFIDPSESFALRLLGAGAIALFVGLRSHSWADCAQAVYPIYGAGMSVGETLQSIHNRYLRHTSTVSVPLLTPGEPDCPARRWNTTYLRVSTLVLYGDPAYVPFPHAAEQHHGLPTDFNPLARADDLTEVRE